MSDRHGHHAKNTGATPPVLRTTARRIPGTAVVCRLDGEVGQDQKEMLEAHLAEVVKAGQPRLVFERQHLGERGQRARVVARDSTGLNPLLQTRKDAEAAGQRLVLAAPSPTVRCLPEITGTDEVFTICGSVRAALAATGSPG